jgi:multidrug efflux pump subunit AcrA (membrane-fusion protein)
MKKRMAKRNILIGFAIFLLFMGICTVVAKGIYAAGLPIITVEEPKRVTLNKDITFNATVLSGDTYGIYEIPGLRLEQLYVKEGQSFAAGDLLFSIDTTDLADIVTQKQISIDTLAARAKEIQNVNANSKKERDIKLTRAQEDSVKGDRDSQLLVQRKREIYDDAKKELSDYLAEIPDVSAGDAAFKQQKELLEDALRAANWELEDALLAQTDGAAMNKRVIEDIESETNGYSAEEEANRLEMKWQQEQLLRLQTILDRGGEVYAEEAGTVQNLALSVGERTTDGACLFYYRNEDSQILEATLTQEEAENIALGDTQTLRLQHNDNSFTESKEMIDYRQNAGNDQVILRWYLDTPDIKVGQSVSVFHPSQTEFYDTCIPVNALYNDPYSGYYVYVAQERDGILGTQWVARRIYVILLNQDQNMCAIRSASIHQDTLIITEYDKPLSDSAPVRLVD